MRPETIAGGEEVKWDRLRDGPRRNNGSDLDRFSDAAAPTLTDWVLDFVHNITSWIS